MTIDATLVFPTDGTYHPFVQVDIESVESLENEYRITGSAVADHPQKCAPVPVVVEFCLQPFGGQLTTADPHCLFAPYRPQCS